MSGCGPYARNQRHQNNQAPFGTDPYAHPWARLLWWNVNDDESGRNDPNEAENEEKLGTAGQTETEGEN